MSLADRITTLFEQGNSAPRDEARDAFLRLRDELSLGKVRANTMIDLAATSTKLRDRAARLVAEQLQCDYNDAVERLQSHDWNLRAAINSAK